MTKTFIVDILDVVYKDDIKLLAEKIGLEKISTFSKIDLIEKIININGKNKLDLILKNLNKSGLEAINSFLGYSFSHRSKEELINQIDEYIIRKFKQDSSKNGKYEQEHNVKIPVIEKKEEAVKNNRDEQHSKKGTQIISQKTKLSIDEVIDLIKICKIKEFNYAKD